ncbi:MAG: hypothetical protein WCJ35_25150 [Planctomycetota bacterium]
MFMNAQESVSCCSTAAEEFDHHEQRSDGLRVIESLCGGLILIRDTLYARIHTDVERRMGGDSMIFPLSGEKSERTTKQEIEIYQVVVAAGAAQSKGYVTDGNWFLDWLTQLRLGDVDGNSRAARRISHYVGKSASDQRLAFSNVLTAALPEASRSPLVLLRLVPAAVQISAALAFGKSVDAQHWRHDQTEILPSIADCYRCHGNLLENGEQCMTCGNPLWTYEWLTNTDG